MLKILKKLKMPLVAVLALGGGLNGFAGIFTSRSGEIFQATREGPGDIACGQLAVGLFTFPLGIPFIATGFACACVDELAVSPVVDLICLPYDLRQPRHGFLVHFSDDGGRPLPGVRFGAIEKGMSGTGRIDAVSDADGNVAVSRLHEKYHIQVDSAERDGYYGLDGGVDFRPSKNIPKDDSSPIVLNLPLRKIHNPVPMAYSRLELPNSIKRVAVTNLLFDCVYGDWLPPFGKGKTADLELFRSEVSGPSNNHWSYSNELAIAVLNRHDGFIKDKVVRHCKFKSAYAAPTNAAYAVKSLHGIWMRDWGPDKRTFKDESDFSDDQYCIVRLRTRLNDDGSVRSAYYGKLMSLGRGGYYLSIYVACEENETSLEAQLGPNPAPKIKEGGRSSYDRIYEP